MIVASVVSIRFARSSTLMRNVAVSRDSASSRLTRRSTTTKTTTSATKMASGRISSTGIRRPSALPRPKLGDERRADLEQVADHDEVRELGDGGVRVAVNGDDGLGSLHPHLVLDRARDSQGQVQGRLHDLAGLADLTGVVDPARVDSRTGRPDGTAERIGQLLEQLHALRAAETSAPGHHDPRFFNGRRAPCLLRP